MPTVFIPASLRPLAGGARTVEVPGTTVRELLLKLEDQFPALTGRLRDGDRLRQGLCVSVNDKVSDRGLMQLVGERDEVHFLAAMGGG